MASSNLQEDPASGGAKREEWWYVYRLQSRSAPTFCYIGLTRHLHRRLRQHNRCENPSTAPYTPLQIVFAAAFPDKRRAQAFEAYLKSGSGHAFANKRLW